MGLYLPVDFYIGCHVLNQALQTTPEEYQFDCILDLCIDFFKSKEDVKQLISLEKNHKEYGLFYVLYSNNSLCSYRLNSPEDDSGWELKIGLAPDILGSTSSIPKEFIPFYNNSLIFE